MSFDIPPELRGEAPAGLGAIIGAFLLKAGFWRKVAYALMGYGVAKVIGPSLATSSDIGLNLVVFFAAIFGLRIIEGVFDAVSEFEWKKVIADTLGRFGIGGK